jgi:glycosyltransferase involved in cell wall biosynthesis
MRIVILTQYYPPEIGAPQNRLSDLARRLAAGGHSMRVLTAMPSYPGNEVLPGYRGKSVAREEMDGVAVRRVSLYVPRRKTFSKRVLHYCSFAAHACWRGPELLEPADFLMTESPPLFLGPAGFYLSRRLRARFIFNVSDLWPDSAIDLGFLKEGPAARAARGLEEWCYRRADLITGQSEGIVASIRARIPGKRVELLPNGVDLETWGRRPDRDGVRREFGWASSDFVVGYAGLHGHAQALHQVLAAAGTLETDKRIRFVFFGEGPCKESLVRQAEAERLRNVTFHSPEPAGRMPEILSAVDAGLVTLARGPVFEGVRPSKVFEVMAAGKPVVLAANGESGRLVAAARCGLVAPPETPALLGEAVRRLAGDAHLCTELGQNGRSYVAAQFSRAQIATNFENVLLSLPS